MGGGKCNLTQNYVRNPMGSKNVLLRREINLCSATLRIGQILTTKRPAISFYDFEVHCRSLITSLYLNNYDLLK